MQEIQGKTRTVRELLSGAKYGIDYYQREYKWQSKQIAELVDDLTGRFLDDYGPEDKRKDVAHYGHYFLGSIIISQRDNERMVVDGQQRLTSLTLLLTYLHNLQKVREDAEPVEDLIFSKKFGEKSFNLSVPDRNNCMEALFEGKPYDTTGKAESVINLMGRYQDIDEVFPDELREKALPYFVDWLLEKVNLVEITAYADEDAYTIFETMNDRGLSLSATDMLKGYLLANIEEGTQRAEANKCIKQWLLKFQERSRETEADFFKTWLRSQYAQKIRLRKKDAKPEDFDLIGTEYHRWVRSNADLIGLTDGAACYQWITRDLDFYARVYFQLLQAAKTLTPGLESIRYNADHGFTQQYQLLLAPLKPEDDESTIQAKLKLVADYIDCWLNRRLWNFKSINYSTLQYTVFIATLVLRGLSSLTDIRKFLMAKLLDEDKELNFSRQPYLNNWNAKSLHRQLARMIDWVEQQSGEPGQYSKYVVRSGKHAYEIEHIWANHYERHTHEFDSPGAFAGYRNRLGGLLLLPKKINASLNDRDYDYKVDHYVKENLLARSLHTMCYQNNPGFKQMVQRTGLPFRAFYKADDGEKSIFAKDDLEKRFQLYRQIAERLWSVERLRNGEVVEE
ncbi:DUF262 domain-containing protein [Leptolyngbyaceae cyanobacterium CCMR0082]|uniref:DUF262 domain-containing protein n=1 Tax=Adonisia turfae CCMR0082 TaxID=2304604 RepID=A0A6M0S062_9CYAN|nr:DUF262 domain-containing protein [Adonisia turfae]NEZ61776.1 DUF262 domain-containing protein [Adonisia turfae CCMR0082]